MITWDTTAAAIKSHSTNTYHTTVPTTNHAQTRYRFRLSSLSNEPASASLWPSRHCITICWRGTSCGSHNICRTRNPPKLTQGTRQHHTKAPGPGSPLPHPSSKKESRWGGSSISHDLVPKSTQRWARLTRCRLLAQTIQAEWDESPHRRLARSHEDRRGQVLCRHTTNG